VLDEPGILLDELLVEGGRVQQAGAWDREDYSELVEKLVSLK
jgi:hypothetical protein